MQPPWIAHLFHRLSEWLPLRVGPPAVAARGRVHIRIGAPSLQPWQDSDSALPDWDSPGGLNSSHARAVAIETELRPAVTPLALIREEFVAALRDIASANSVDLRQRVRRCPSLRGLWHLRADVFNEVAMQRSEHEAQSRLAQLNRHFPCPARSLSQEVHRQTQPGAW
jgi:hypothetical protein